MNSLLIELLEASSYIDELLYKDAVDKNLAPFIVVSKGTNIFSASLSFSAYDVGAFEIPLYCSEYDDRLYYEETDKYESFEDYFIRKIKFIQNKIKEINI